VEPPKELSIKGRVEIPETGQRVSLETAGLPGGLDPENTHSFMIDLTGGAVIVHVPGHNMGPDNCTPHCQLQEAWLDGLASLMRRSWGCQWTIHDREALESFMKMLRPVVKTYRVIIG
jgi:hypothetical protein